jgi:NADPH:quinone reductase
VGFGAAGNWQEYVCAPANACIALPADVSFEEGAFAIANPLSTLSFVDIARAGGHRSVCLPVAASAIGRMVIAQMRRRGIEVICTVRRQAQADMLKRDHGVRYVLVTSSSSFESDLAKLAAELECRLAFDSTGGAPTCAVLRALPPGSVLYIYGVLLNEPEHLLANLDPGLFIFSNKQLRGFFLLEHLKRLPLWKVIAMARKVPGLLKTDLKTHCRATYPFERAEDAIKDYVADMTAGKVVLSARIE